MSFRRARELSLAVFESAYLMHLMTVAGGDVAVAAGLASIPRGTLYRLLKKRRIEPSSFR